MSGFGNFGNFGKPTPNKNTNRGAEKQNTPKHSQTDGSGLGAGFELPEIGVEKPKTPISRPDPSLRQNSAENEVFDPFPTGDDNLVEDDLLEPLVSQPTSQPTARHKAQSTLEPKPTALPEPLDPKLRLGDENDAESPKIVENSENSGFETPNPLLTDPTNSYDDSSAVSAGFLQAVDEGRENQVLDSEYTEKSTKAGLKDLQQNIEFFDANAGKLNPFGENSSFKGVDSTVSRSDKRKNLKTRANVVTGTILATCLLLVGFGAKQTFFPSNLVTENEVTRIVQTHTGMTGFPLEAGKGIATDFINAYLTVGGDPSADSVLGYYYAGDLKPSNSNDLRSTGGNFKQGVLNGPNVYSAKPVDEHSAMYTVGALVAPEDTKTEAPKDGSNAQWVFFNVNVFYDAETNRFGIPKNSPTIVSPMSVETNIPKAKAIGKGSPNKELLKEVETTVKGFLQAYGKSTSDNNSDLKPFLVNDAELLAGMSGLGGEFEITDINSLELNAYDTETEGEAKVTAKVPWSHKEGEASITYRSSYVLTLTKQADGTYKISKFVPEAYVFDEGETAE